MSTLRGIRTTIGVAAAASVLALAGCSSSGSIGKSSAAGDSKTSGGPAAVDSKSSSGDSSTSGSSDSSAPSSDSSSSSSGDSDNSGSGATDPGCAAAMDAMSGAMKNLNVSDPAGAKKMIQDIAGKMHDAAGKSKKPDAAAAINKVADDYTNLANSLGGGGVPNMSGLQNDATALGTACS
ncbi:MAG: hypothetical protein HOV87_36460 [Catenulispora sp.]|nr:hypothetical protein [Catenulispora sp.]